MSRLSTIAVEKSSYIVKADFSDEDGNAVIPNTVSYTLTDKDGNVINSIEGENVAAAATVYIVLSGDDLQLTGSSEGGNGEKRVLTVEAVYTSTLSNPTLGNSLLLKQSVVFYVQNLRAVS